MLETSLRPSWGFSNLNMHMTDLAGLLKCRFLMPQVGPEIPDF